MRRYYLLLLFTILGFLIGNASDRWAIQTDGSLLWKIDKRLPHSDHIEMSGQKMSVVLRYGVNEHSAFFVNRSLVFPMLRMKPNKTQDNLKQRFDVNIPQMITVNDLTLTDEQVDYIKLNGIMEVESSFSTEYKRKKEPHAVSLHRRFCPSPYEAYYVEEYTLTNNTSRTLRLRVPLLDIRYETPENDGVYGSYVIEAKTLTQGVFAVDQGKSFTFYVVFFAHRNGDIMTSFSPDAVFTQRTTLLSQWQNHLVLTTPDNVLNTMFAFAKVRASESIYLTKGGFMHGPGGEAYYAAIWANDEAEYVNPFFPYLGYDMGNESALNAYRHFARYMNDDYKAIPSSIISEGIGIWHGAKDRGDGAMIAYGAARYALTRGQTDEALQLWPLIEWCLEYCRRQLTKDGVVASDSDELENRFPAGKANLCTSCLYYDALNSAVYLGKALHKSKEQLNKYHSQAVKLRESIERHFGAEMKNYHTYRYYEGNTLLRSWICMPLTVGIYDRSEGTIAAIFSPYLWTEDGLLTQEGSSTYWDRSLLYALRGTFSAGEVDMGSNYLSKYSRHRLLGEHIPYAIEAWPEGNQRQLSAESGLYCRIFIEGILGIRPIGFRAFHMSPHLPNGWNKMSLRHIMAFGHDFDIIIRRTSNGYHVRVIAEGKKVTEKTITQNEQLTIKFNNKK